jgi:Flagellar biosynthesis/type III secretory pathway chaperone
VNKREALLRAVGDDIQRDRDDYQRLRELLQTLYQALLARELRRIEEVNPQITALIDAARARAERRSKILRAFGCAADAGGMQRLLASCPPPRRETLRQAWQQLGTLAAECSQLNERNGRLLAMQHDILQQLLGGDAPLYAPPAY